MCLLFTQGEKFYEMNIIERIAKKTSLEQARVAYIDTSSGISIISKASTKMLKNVLLDSSFYFWTYKHDEVFKAIIKKELNRRRKNFSAELRKRKRKNPFKLTVF